MYLAIVIADQTPLYPHPTSDFLSCCLLLVHWRINDAGARCLPSMRSRVFAIALPIPYKKLSRFKLGSSWGKHHLVLINGCVLVRIRDIEGVF